VTSRREVIEKLLADFIPCHLLYCDRCDGECVGIIEYSASGVEYTESEPQHMPKTLKNTPIVVPEAVRRKAGLRRGEPIEFKVSRRAITIVPKAPFSEDYPLETVTRIIKETKENPLTHRQAAALEAELQEYGGKRAKKANVKERDIPQLIHESRARRRKP
jgi:bifunctional DNA-binding transcriptional regulator/antitoxin component of YhaV-PrlF toxin-antitoxin module